jgi:hypothetical protein
MLLFHGRALMPGGFNSALTQKIIRTNHALTASSKVAVSCSWSMKGSLATKRTLATMDERAFAKKLEEDQKAKLRYWNFKK